MTERQGGPLERIRRTGLIAILRGIEAEDADPTVDALVDAGVEALEFTADTAGALEFVKRQRERVAGRAAIGVGTVREAATVRDAIDAGATFVVTPTVQPPVIEACVERDTPVIPGAYTPTEAVTAARAGAAMVKLFPASTGGPSHLQAFRGPLPDIPLVPTGGVTVESAGDYIAAGATAVGVGGGLRPTGALDRGDYAAVTERAEAILGAVDRAR